MRTLLITGSDTGVGKTWVTAALARIIGANGLRVQIVKPVQTGAVDGEDAREAQRLAGCGEAHTLFSFQLPLAPVTAAAAEERVLMLEGIVAAVRQLPSCDWRLIEGAGGVATPLDHSARDWADFGTAAEVDGVILVVADRLGAINQARLAAARARAIGVPVALWLNCPSVVAASVAISNREGLRDSGLPVLAEQPYGAGLPIDSAAVREFLLGLKPRSAEEPLSASPRAESVTTDWIQRCRAALEEREQQRRRRALTVSARSGATLNLADNDYLELAWDPAVAQAAAEATRVYGSSSSASPLITGWQEPHGRLVDALARWHRFPCGLLWSSGYAANGAVLGTLPQRGDLILADRLIHHSMIAGLQRSGALFRRYEHLNLSELEAMLAKEVGQRRVFVATESVFSMDGDYPDLRKIAELKRRYGFCWILDEAHGLGWFGPEGSGLARAVGVEGDVDILVGTLGKTLASGGAYSLFRDSAVRDYLVNFAGEFIYSTSLPPANAAAALAALERVRALAAEQEQWHARSQAFRGGLRANGWDAPSGVSPIVPLILRGEAEALRIADALKQNGIWCAAVRPPTVPVGTSRLRFSLKRSFGLEPQARVLQALEQARSVR